VARGIGFNEPDRWRPAPRSGWRRRPRPGRCPRDGPLLDYVLIHPFATKRAELCAEQGLRTGGSGGAPVYGTARPHFHSCPASAGAPRRLATRPRRWRRGRHASKRPAPEGPRSSPRRVPSQRARLRGCVRAAHCGGPADGRPEPDRCHRLERSRRHGVPSRVSRLRPHRDSGTVGRWDGGTVGQRDAGWDSAQCPGLDAEPRNRASSYYQKTCSHSVPVSHWPGCFFSRALPS